MLNDADQLDSPALLFYPERIAANIARLISSIDDIGRLRPHVKTHKNAEITRMMIDAGITKFKCATIAEAEMLGICGAADVLLAYQPVGPKVNRLISLIKTYPDTHFSCLADHPDTVKFMADAAMAAGLQIDLYLDLNVGMNRTGIKPDESALALYQLINKHSGTRILGLHAYDGHIHDTDFEVRKEKWQHALHLILALEKDIIEASLPKPIIIAGGTPTYPFYVGIESAECSPGTFALWDKGYQETCAEQEYLTSALLLCRVISLTAATTVTVDLGHKSVAAENALSNRVFFLNAPNAKFIGQSEEHLVLELGADHGFKPGEVLYGLPVHVCPTVALYSSAQTVYQHQITGEWKIVSRERKINI